MKIKSFSCETFCANTQSEKEANSNSEVEAKSAYEPSGPSGPGRGTPYNGLYGEAPPERGTFFRLQVYKRRDFTSLGI